MRRQTSPPQQRREQHGIDLVAPLEPLMTPGSSKKSLRQRVGECPRSTTLIIARVPQSSILDQASVRSALGIFEEAYRGTQLGSAQRGGNKAYLICAQFTVAEQRK